MCGEVLSGKAKEPLVCLRGAGASTSVLYHMVEPYTAISNVIIE